MAPVHLPRFRGRLPIGIALVLVALLAGPSRSQTTELTYHLEWQASDLTLRPGDTGTRVSLAGAATVQETGAPALPYVVVELALPYATRLAGVEVQIGERRSLPVPGEVARVDAWTSDEGITTNARHQAQDLAWSGSGAYPREWALAAGTQYLHGYGIGVVHVFPVRLNADGSLEQALSCTLTVTLEDVADPARIARREVAWPGRDDLDLARVREVVDNPGDLTRFAPPPGREPVSMADGPGLGKVPAPPEGPVDYLIVTVPSLVPEFQRLADLRTQEGLKTSVVTVDWILANHAPAADMQETLRNFLRAAYSKWGLRYVLLGGDSAVLPPRYAESLFYPGNGVPTAVPADLYFAALDGNWNDDADGKYGEAYRSFQDLGDNADLYAELAVGRAPVNDLTEAATFVDKTIEYSRPSQVGYQGRALFASEVLFPYNWDGIEPITLDGATFSENIIFNSIIGGGNLMQSYRLYENHTAYVGSMPLSKAATVDSLQTGGFGLYNHIGHGFYYNMSLGDANLFVNDAEALTNGPNYFSLYALNCSSCAFDFNCLLERFIQNPNGGSAISIGACRAAFATTADLYQQAYYAEIFVELNTRVGDAVLESRLPFTGSTFTDTPHRWTHLTYTLLGDPTVRIWREDPTIPTVIHDASVAVGDATLTVDVRSGGVGVFGASVGLTRSDGGFAQVQTDLSGTAVLPLNTLAMTQGTLDIVVSGRNLLPYVGTVSVVAPAGPHVAAALETIDDGSLAPADGDGDGMADSGETVHLMFNFTNNGDGSTASNVMAVLSAVDAVGATIVDDTISVGNVAPASSVSPGDGFVVDLDPSITDESFLEFEVSISSGGATWVQDFTLEVRAPEPRVVRLTWDDTAGGNGDGTIDPGEIVDLLFEIRNFASGDTGPLTGSLSTGSGNVTLVDPNNTWSTLGLLESATGNGVFQIIESDTSVENSILLTLQDDWGHSWSHSFELRPPSPPNDPSTDASLGVNTIAVLVDAAYQPHFWGYRIYRSMDENGPFEELTVDPLDHTGFFRDDGLASLTRYYYRASVVDSSMVESAPSTVVAGNTAPPELDGGFPIPIGRVLAGAAAVGDMRGDGTLVVTFGADFLYAIDATGNELVDGDLDSQTLGPLGGPPPPDDRFSPSGVAMGDLDGDGKLEVVGNNWQTAEMWALNEDGTSVPGFPVWTRSKAWCHPVLADIDNDQDLELITRNVGGDTFVFHHDGSEFLDGDGNPTTVGVFHDGTENFPRGTPCVLDLDGDQTLEIIFPTHVRDGVTDNFVHALKNDGSPAPGWPRNLGPGGYGVVGIVAADLNRDGIMELIYPCDNDQLYVFEPDGSDFPGFPIPLTNQGANLDSVTPGAAVADFDKDGDLEMVLVSVLSNSACRVYIMDHDGTPWPGWPRQLPGRSETSPVIGDINGDNSLDILVGIGGGSDTLPNQLHGFNADGSDVQGFPITLGGSVKSTPIITDFDKDGDVDVVYAGYDLKLHVWDMPFDYHPWATPWPTFHANARRTGVYLEDVVTAVASASFELLSTSAGISIESGIVGNLPSELTFHLDRQVVEEGAAHSFIRIAEGLQLHNGRVSFTDADVRAGSTYRYRLADSSGALEFTSQTVTVPVRQLVLTGNQPNPFNPATTISFEVPGGAGSPVPTTLDVYDLAGRRVTRLLAKPLEPGLHEVTWDGTDQGGRTVSSGVYIAKLRAAGQFRSLKMTLVK